ncbi:mycofactocin-coupled SDR family oxidoreductase [soil metagenome]
MSDLTGKVAFITGAARGQGRSHALRLARDGADIVAVDLAGQIDTIPYPMASTSDLDETACLVRDVGRRVIAQTVDVRDQSALRASVASATTEFGRIDIVVANAGVVAAGKTRPDDEELFRDIVEVNLFGVWNTVVATVPPMLEAGRGGSIILTSSTQGLTGRGGDGSAAFAGYTSSKHGVVGLMRTFANAYAKHNIRVNSVHPTGVSTPMVLNDFTAAFLTEHPEAIGMAENLLPVPFIEPEDVSAAVAWLAGDEARYVTGIVLPVDAGFTAR